MIGPAATLCIALLAASQGSEPQAPATTFRSNIDLVPVDVNVLDRNGRPVADLRPEDFTLTVDGKARRIGSAQFIAVDRAVENAPEKPKEYASNAGAQGGRLVMVVIDSGNIGAGRGKLAIDAAARFVGSLNRSDRVALVNLPGAGPQIEFTSNHAIVQAHLSRITGQAGEDIGQKRVGLAESLAIQRGDRPVIDEVTSRECPSNSSAEVYGSCLRQLTAEAGYMLTQVRQRTNNTLVSLRHLFERMTASDTPKTILLISEGLLLDREYNDVAWIEPGAAAAHATLYVLQLDAPDLEAAAHRTSPSRGEDREVLREGLDRLAGMAKGDVFRVGGNADFAFQRLTVELSGYYLLSFEPAPGDRDGKSHKIRIDVKRKDLTLRSRREFSVGPPASRTTENVVIQTLRAPLLATDIPLKLTTYTFQDAESSKLKIILATDIDRSRNPQGPLALGYLMFDAKGALVASELESAIANPIERNSNVQKYLGAAVAPPGTYTLKVAVVDESGRKGSVERTFEARINGFGQLHVTDLLIADNSVPGTKGLPPAVAADFAGNEIHGYVELFSDSPEQLSNATVVMEVAQSDTSRALDSTPARFQQVQAGANRRRVAEAGVPIALLPTGEYVARAVVSVSGRRVGQVVRPFRVTRTAAAVAAPGAGGVTMNAAAPIAFSSRTETFERASVLTAPVVGFFLDRLSAAAAANIATLRPAVENVRAGHFTDAGKLLDSTSDQLLAAVFLKGLVLLSAGDVKGAAARFEDAIRRDPEFYAAAFYLGACHAAEGKDREAAVAWQKSLITESNASFVYTLLGDAFLRLHDMDRAIDVLTEARTLWPADDQVTIRLATALVTANKPAEGMKVLQPYLSSHPADADRLFLALRAMYQAASAGQPLSAAERTLFSRYAAAYAAAGGAQQDLVGEWRKYVEK